MAYILILLLISPNGSPASMEVGRFKKQAECTEAAAKLPLWAACSPSAARREQTNARTRSTLIRTPLRTSPLLTVSHGCRSGAMVEALCAVGPSRWSDIASFETWGLLPVDKNVGRR